MSADAEDDALVDDAFHLGVDSIMEDGFYEDYATSTEGSHTSGKQLRRRLVTQESIDELAAVEKPSLLQRIFGRK
jgi:hypothetical protein